MIVTLAVVLPLVLIATVCFVRWIVKAERRATANREAELAAVKAPNVAPDTSGSPVPGATSTSTSRTRSRSGSATYTRSRSASNPRKPRNASLATQPKYHGGGDMPSYDDLLSGGTYGSGGGEQLTLEDD